MAIEQVGFTEEELEIELGSWQITALANDFGSSYKTLYKTNFTTIAAKSFLIPEKETGEIHHFNLSIRVFKRGRKSEPWVEQGSLSENQFGQHKQIDIDAGDGKAVKELTDFLLAQYALIGTKIESNKVIIDEPTDYDIKELLKKMTLGQIENFGQGIRIQALKEYREFLIQNLSENETFIQNWLDEDSGKYRKQRCLIFGLEFIDHKREGQLSSKRFDILTRSSVHQNEYAIIELKSPKDEIFKIKEVENSNGGTSVEYHLSPELSRAIPQILRYKSKFDSTAVDDDDLRRIGIEKGTIKKCIILLGVRHFDDSIWENHFSSLKSNLSNTLEIWTYSDLIEKLEVTLMNLEENLNLE
ncbi:MAG: Shedu anti-phage system protein SduA domain-containing protein [Saprospiraceae bacterium]